MSAERVTERRVEPGLETIVGPMFSGKTLELWRLVDRLQIAGINVQVFNHSLDARYGETAEIKSHAGVGFSAIKVRSAGELLEQVKEETQVVVIDEVQFFQERGGDDRYPIVRVIENLISQGKRVIVAGLAADFRDDPFNAVPELMAKAEKVTKLTAICMICGDEASKTQRLIDGKPAPYNSPVIVVGGKDLYEARCRQHHQVPGRPKPTQEDEKRNF